MNIIALMGRSRSGKNTVGEMIEETMPGEVGQLAFADKLKTLCMELFGLAWDDVFTDEGKARASRFPCWKCPSCSGLDCAKVELGRETKIECRRCSMIGDVPSFSGFWTNRMILQHVGTEGCRAIDDQVWVNFLLRKAREVLDGNAVGRTSDMPPVRAVIVTDCRFRSEAEAVWKAGGEVWRIRRPETDQAHQGIAAHASELEMDTIPDSLFQQIIMNDSTLDDLRERVLAALVGFFERHPR